MATLDHLRYLVETIGPRGSTTPKEAEAAVYAARILQAAGLEPKTEQFISARSAWYPYALFSAILLVAEGLLWTADRWRLAPWIAAGLGLAALISVLLELAFRPNLLRWVLPKGRSQNAWAYIAPQGEVRRKVVISGHLDTHRTPLVFSSERWVRFFSRLVPIGLAASVLLIVLFLLEGLWPTALWKPLSLPFALTLLTIFAITLQADLTPYTVGANDNASGAALVLSTAEWLAQHRLQHTAVWAVLTGCEEVACYGAEDFARRHQHELGPEAIWLTVDSVAGTQASPAYLTDETFLLTVRSDPQLLQIAEQVAARHPEWDAHSFSFRGAYTEGAVAAKYGFRVLTITGHRRDGVLPEWHRPTDDLAHLDTNALQHSEAFFRQVLLELDRQ